jgi:hypothetical protein
MASRTRIRAAIAVSALLCLSACGLTPTVPGMPQVPGADPGSGSATDTDTGTGSPNELDQLAGPAPHRADGWTTEDLWQDSSELDWARCHELALDEYLIRLQSNPHIEETLQFYEPVVSCAWTGLTALVDFPIDYPAQQYWTKLVYGDPAFEPEPDVVGSLDLGNDSALIKKGGAAGRVFIGVAVTDDATYLFRIVVDELIDSGVSDEYYAQAMRIVLAKMMENYPDIPLMGE